MAEVASRDWSVAVSLMPRPPKLSTMNVATPMPLSSERHPGMLLPTPLEPWTRTTAGTRPDALRGMLSSPQITAAGASRLRRAKSPGVGVWVWNAIVPVVPSARSVRGCQREHADRTNPTSATLKPGNPARQVRPARSMVTPPYSGARSEVSPLRLSGLYRERGQSATAEGTAPSTGALQCNRDKKEAVMKKILGLTLVAMLSLTLAAPVSAGGGPGGGFHGRFHGGFHHDGFHRFGCCFGPAFVGGVFVGSALAYPYYADPYYAYAAYPVYSDPVYGSPPAYQPETQVTVAPSVQRDVCYNTGCY